MNVFEDLVVELKEQNLLESTFVDADEDAPADPHADMTWETDDDVDFGDVEPALERGDLTSDGQSEIDITDEPHSSAVENEAPAENSGADKPSGKEFFKKKAVGEISSLQMVEHVITGVEREYLKIVPKTFDDFAAKMSLNAFLNTDAAIQSEEHATAEFTLIQETECWCTALAERDRNVPVSSLREYCERSRPALSSQALLALGRFYRNLPYSEPVRSKFDFVITRLFSRPSGNEKRICLFSREDMLRHINTLYSDWSSVPLYAADDNVANVTLTALSFEDLAIEAESAATFDELIEGDFFGRLRMFKESISELFYAPEVTAADIDCNIRIGNAYVDLIDRDRQKLDADAVQQKYADHDSAVSEMTGKTLQLADLLRELAMAPAEEPVVETEIHVSADPAVATRPKRERAPRPVAKPASFLQRMKANAFSLNKWYLVVATILIGASVGLYVWANFAAGEKITTTGVKTFTVENTELREFITTARISGDTFYAQMLPSWDKLPKEKRQEYLQQIFVIAKNNGCTQVDLLGSDGKSVGYASASRIEVAML